MVAQFGEQGAERRQAPGRGLGVLEPALDLRDAPEDPAHALGARTGKRDRCPEGGVEGTEGEAQRMSRGDVVRLGGRRVRATGGLSERPHVSGHVTATLRLDRQTGVIDPAERRRQDEQIAGPQVTDRKAFTNLAFADRTTRQQLATTADEERDAVEALLGLTGGLLSWRRAAFDVSRLLDELALRRRRCSGLTGPDGKQVAGSSDAHRQPFVGPGRHESQQRHAVGVGSGPEVVLGQVGPPTDTDVAVRLRLGTAQERVDVRIDPPMGTR